MSELSSMLRQLCEAYPHERVSLGQIFRFVLYAASLKNDILLPQPASHPPSLPPVVLPQAIHTFLSGACQLAPDFTDHCWTVLKDVVWNDADFSVARHASTFSHHRHSLGLCMLFPPCEYA
jgi:hypothetical protein